MDEILRLIPIPQHYAVKELKAVGLKYLVIVKRLGITSCDAQWLRWSPQSFEIRCRRFLVMPSVDYSCQETAESQSFRRQSKAVVQALGALAVIEYLSIA